MSDLDTIRRLETSIAYLNKMADERLTLIEAKDARIAELEKEVKWREQNPFDAPCGYKCGYCSGNPDDGECYCGYKEWQEQKPKRLGP